MNSSHPRLPFGTFASVNKMEGTTGNTNNAMVSRTRLGICLGPTGNEQGTYKFLHLRTGNAFKGDVFTGLPMTQDVSDRVVELARTKQPGLVFLDGRKQIIPDTIDQEDTDEDDDNFDDYASATGDSDASDDETLYYHADADVDLDDFDDIYPTTNVIGPNVNSIDDNDAVSLPIATHIEREGVDDGGEDEMVHPEIEGVPLEN